MAISFRGRAVNDYITAIIGQQKLLNFSDDHIEPFKIGIKRHRLAFAENFP
jgi:hypothetical protein